MEKEKMPAKSLLTFSSSPPSPIPTGKGSRSAAGPFLSEYIVKSIQIPEPTLPQHLHRFKPEEINYGSLVLRENDSVRGLLRSAREYGVFSVIDHGISTEELRLALSISERIFGLTVECCTSYGDHEKLVWRGDDQEILEKANIVIGEHNTQIFRQKMENVASKLEAIAEELVKVIPIQSDTKQSRMSILLGESTLRIYRYHRASIIDRISSIIEETSEESGPYTLSLHLLLESGEFCLQSDRGILSFNTSPNTIVVTMGKKLEEWSQGEFKCANSNRELMFKPYLRASRPSFSIEQKWSSSNLRSVTSETNNILSLTDQILILLILAMFYESYVYLYS